MQKKSLTQVAIMLATFLLAVPMTPAVMAATPASLSITPASPNVDIGQSFTATVAVSGASNVNGFDVRVSYDPNILTATSATIIGTAFDPTGSNPSCTIPTPISPACVLEVKHLVLNSIGLVREAAVFVSGNSAASGGTLVSISFTVALGPSASANELPSAISLSGTVVAFDSTGATVVVPVTVSGASYSPPANVALRSVGCRATLPGFNVGPKGTVDTMFCRIINNGSQSITAGASFTWTSLNGVTGSASTPGVTLAPGQTAQPTASITVPLATDIFVVTGTAVRFITMPDGSIAQIPGGSLTFFITVNTA